MRICEKSDFFREKKQFEIFKYFGIFLNLVLKFSNFFGCFRVFGFWGIFQIYFCVFFHIFKFQIFQILFGFFPFFSLQNYKGLQRFTKVILLKVTEATTEHQKRPKLRKEETKLLPVILGEDQDIFPSFINSVFEDQPRLQYVCRKLASEKKLQVNPAFGLVHFACLCTV